MVWHYSKKVLFLSLGWLSLLLGLVGAILPILPTTPFAILAAYFFSKGSDRLHKWLLRQPILGPLIVDWESSGVIRRKPKIYSTLMILVLFSYTIIFIKIWWGIKLLVSGIGVLVLWFIWSRPEVGHSSERE